MALLVTLSQTADIENTYRVIVTGCGRMRAFDLATWVIDNCSGKFSYGAALDNRARFIFTDADSAFAFKMRFG